MVDKKTRGNREMENEDEDVARRFSQDLATEISSIQCVIMFGSVARGAAGESSDIDLLVVIDDSRPERFAAQVSRVAMRAMGDRDIQPVLTNLSDIEPTFLARVLREGKVIFGKVIVEGNRILRPMRMIRYSTKGISASSAVRISQIVHGYTTRKRVEDKEYISRIKAVGWSPANGLIILPEEKVMEFEKILKERRVKFESFDIWM